MAAVTGIAWTDATVNFWIGCTKVGPGCDGCYAAALALRRWQIVFEAGGERRKSKSAFDNPLRWHLMHQRGETHMRVARELVPVPVWLFALSLGDFFDKEIPPVWRAEAWNVIKATPRLRWQVATKRVGNVPKMLPADWNGGAEYEHVGIIATVVNQDETDRDVPKLRRLKVEQGVKWVGLSIEPQIGPVVLTHVAFAGATRVDWVISGGESVQVGHRPRVYDIAWGRALLAECRAAGVPFSKSRRVQIRY
jgi:protein gp37